MTTVKKISGKSDFGNSNMKIILDNSRFYQPSTIEYLDTTSSFTDNSIDSLVENLFDDLVANITSPSIKRSGLYSLGKRANLNPLKAKNMNINLGNKYAHDIPILMDLGMTAAYAVQQYYQENKALPETPLEIQKVMTGAIPASEFKNADATSKGYSTILQDRFLGNEKIKKHTVIIYVGSNPVTVNLQYTSVKITQEGVPALYGILEAKPKKLKTKEVTILDLFNKLYENSPERLQLTQRDLVGKRLLVIDIGAGTTEYIHAKNWKPINPNCDGKSQGVGHAASRASLLLQSDLSGNVTINRQRFDQILLDPSDSLHEDAKAHMKQTMYSEAESIMETIQERYSLVSGDIDLFVVMGGGSIAFKDHLYDQLAKFADSVKCMVLWIPEEYAVDLNLDGLDVMHDNIFFKNSEPVATPKINKAPSKREV